MTPDSNRPITALENYSAGEVEIVFSGIFMRILAALTIGICAKISVFDPSTGVKDTSAMNLM